MLLSRIFIVATLLLTSAFVLHGGGGVQGGQTIQSVQLSGSGVQFGTSGPYYVGTLTTRLSPQTPSFNNVSGSSYAIVSSGGSCSGGDTTHFQIIGDGVYTNTLGANISPGYKLCITAGATGVTSVTTTFTGITEGHKLDAAATYCAANGGGDGSSGSPWQAACIQAAATAAVDGDTVYLSAGNWALSIASSPVTSSKSINLVGAGSGNTFNATGNPNNPSYASFCPTSSGITCVYATPNASSNGSCSGGSGGFIRLSGAVVNVSRIFFDGSQATDGGDTCGLLNFYTVTGSATATDIRALAYNNSTISAETQVAAFYSNNITWQNSIFNEPLQCSTCGSPTDFNNAQILSTVLVKGEVAKNNVFYGATYNPIYPDNLVFSGNETDNATVGGTVHISILPAQGIPGCVMGNTCATGQGGSPGIQGNLTATISNNYWNAADNAFDFGGGVNDPGTSGGISDLHVTGNWVVGTTTAIDSCEWHIFGYCIGTFGSSVVVGPTINTHVDGSCNPSDSGLPYEIANNSIVGTTSAQLNAQGTGSIACYEMSLATYVALTNKVYGYHATKNYLNSPSNQYNSNSNTISPIVTGNYCAGGSTFTQTDSSTCATSGFTTPPTGSFTIGLLEEPAGAYDVPFTATTFTAQYGAVQWLASTSSTTPTSGGQSGTGCNGGSCSWSHTPPVFLAGVTHGQTVYLWVMDSANQIAAAGSTFVP